MFNTTDDTRDFYAVNDAFERASTALSYTRECFHGGVPNDSCCIDEKLLFVSVYNELSVAMDCDIEAMKTWFHTFQYELRGVPANIARTPVGLERILHFFENLVGEFKPDN